MSWTGIGGAVEAARQGHDAILTPCGVCYFDFVQSDDPSEPRGANWGHPTTVEAVYNFDPAPAELTPEQQHHILGVQSNLWCEYITTMSHAQYMELPRLAALSEVQCAAATRKTTTTSSHASQASQATTMPWVTTTPATRSPRRKNSTRPVPPHRPGAVYKNF